MRKISLISGFLSFFFAMNGIGQTVIFEDNFNDQTLKPQWLTWSKNSLEQASLAREGGVSNSSCLLINQNAVHDMVLPMVETATGTYELSFEMKLLPNEIGYFSIFKENAQAISWPLEFFLDERGAIDLRMGSTAKKLNVDPLDWVSIVITVDLDKKTALMEINEEKLPRFPWSIEELGSLNFFAYAKNGKKAGFKIDNLTLKSLSSNQLLFENNLTLFPNPTSSIINYTLNVKAGNFIVKLMNGNGMLIDTHRLSLNDNENFFDVSHLVKGIYFIEVSGNGEKITRRFVVQ